MKLVRQGSLLCILVAWVVLAARAPASSLATVLTADEALVLRIVNGERSERGLRALVLDSVLTKVAREHSADMADRGYFSHLAPAPRPRTPLDRYVCALEIAPEKAPLIGENIGRAGEPVMAVIHKRMMASAEHRANILDEEYTRMGVGIYALPDGRVWLTEMFGADLPETR